MTTNAPTEHLQDALKLQGDALVDLWEVQLKTSGLIYRFWNGPTRTWQAKTFEGMACNLANEGTGSEGQNSRPTLTVSNPENLFGVFAAEGYFDLATFRRYRLLQTHLTNNQNISEQRIWICGRVLNSTDGVLQLELRSSTDTPAWKTPRRTYSPSDGYPFVML